MSVVVERDTLLSVGVTVVNMLDTSSTLKELS